MPPPRTAATDPTGFDPVSRIFHWLTALLILAAVAVGLWMTRLPVTTEDQVAFVFRAFSLHKTIGVAAFAVALLRILWAFVQRHPGPLHPDRRIENLAADIVHWTLYGAMLVMPLSGWLFHAASPGYAPIVWPFPQTLPFVPADPALAQVLDTIHKTSAWLLYAAIALHVAGTLKHVLIDADATLARMVSGTGPAVPRSTYRIGPLLVAAALWSIVIGYGWQTAPLPASDPFADIGDDVPADPTAP